MKYIILSVGLSFLLAGCAQKPEPSAYVDFNHETKRLEVHEFVPDRVPEWHVYELGIELKRVR